MPVQPEDVITPGSNKVEEIKMNFGGMKLTEGLKKLVDEDEAEKKKEEEILHALDQIKDVRLNLKRELSDHVVTRWYRAPELILMEKDYGSGIDMWSVGTIFYEMAHKRPLFYGDSEIGQIFKIFRTLGTPTEQTWQGFQDLPSMKMSFPQWKVNGNENLRKACTNFDETAIDLLTQLVHLEPGKRISAKAALRHPYFAGF